MGENNMIYLGYCIAVIALAIIIGANLI